MSDLLLLSGGVDSAALAAWKRPSRCVFIDYGQRPADGERRAARQVAAALDRPLDELNIDCSVVGSGLLAGETRDSKAMIDQPSPEWWPFRNQLLVTLAAAHAVLIGAARVIVGTVASDGHRHVDGTADFYRRLDELVAMQEGKVRVSAPAVDLEPVQLLERSGITDSVLGWTHSCHVGDIACGTCPGCLKRRELLAAAGRLQ